MLTVKNHVFRRCSRCRFTIDGFKLADKTKFGGIQINNRTLITNAFKPYPVTHFSFNATRGFASGKSEFSPHGLKFPSTLVCLGILSRGGATCSLRPENGVQKRHSRGARHGRPNVWTPAFQIHRFRDGSDTQYEHRDGIRQKRFETGRYPRMRNDFVLFLHCLPILYVAVFVFRS